MPTRRPAPLQFSPYPFRLRTAALAACTALLAALPASAPALAMQATAPAAPGPRHAKAKHSSAATPVAQAAATPPAAPAIPPPNWPINDKPVPATVAWDSQGLRIQAANSSLQQILKDVSTDTGAKVEGLNSDQRVFGAYGPGPANEVLSQLLNGTGYNVLMIGDQGEGTPRQIVLSAKPTGPAPANSSRNTMNEEDYEAEQQQEAPMQQIEPPNVRNGFQPPEPPQGAPPRTPQQIIQQMQQMQQDQQQNQNNQPK
ncbi:MAG TPA: hypothetical protein VGF96_06675 [Terracidiphilus sp.]